MNIQQIFKIKASDWEASIAGCVVLKGFVVKWGMFEPEAYDRIRALVLKLKALPSAWAIELAISAIEDHPE